MTDLPTSLYTAWLDALPQIFRTLLPTTGLGSAPPGADAPAAGGTAPFPADQIGKALNGLDGILTRLYEGYLPLLAQGNLSAEPLQALADAGAEAFDKLLASLALPAGAGGLPLGLERTFGGLGDAFGLRPSRDFLQALREMQAANVARQRAQAEYLGLVAQAWRTGTQGLVRELQEMGGRGERVESLLAFIRLWAKAVDAPLHDTMQSPRGLVVTAALIRASTQGREQLQKAVGLVGEALDLPTRADMNDAFREIQELKRELRRLKKPALPAMEPARTPEIRP